VLRDHLDQVDLSVQLACQDSEVLLVQLDRLVRRAHRVSRDKLETLASLVTLDGLVWRVLLDHEAHKDLLALLEFLDQWAGLDSRDSPALLVVVEILVQREQQEKLDSKAPLEHLVTKVCFD